MDDEERFDRREEDRPEDEGIPDLDPRLPEKEATGDAQEGLVLPRRDRTQGAEEFGTTAAEQREGEPLEERLSEEQPEREPGGRDAAGRLVEEEGRGLTDQEKDEVGEAAEEDTEGMTAEEEAVRIEEEAPGAVEEESDRYVEEP